jgi:hypothetical protein
LGFNLITTTAHGGRTCYNENESSVAVRKETMRTEIAVPRRVELYVADLDNHVLIENDGGGVVISTSRNNFTDKRKAFFVRHLAAEGYIPDRYAWFSEPAADGFSGVRWVARVSLDGNEEGFESIGNWRTRRNAMYGCCFVAWLLFFVWGVRHIHHGLGL